MPLPKIDVPTYELKVPSTGETIKVRPFSVKEEKLLLIAIESKDQNTVIDTVKQIINNCIIDGDLNLEKLPFYDVDFIFIFLRAKSIGETVEIRMTCNNVLDNGNVCNNVFEADMDIANCEVVKDKTVENDIKLDGKRGLKMKYPSYSTIKRLESNTNIDLTTSMIVNSIDYIYNDKEIHPSKDYTKDELKDFVEGLTEAQYKKLEHYVMNFPTFVVKLEATCPKCGYHHKVRYSDFYDFFF